MGSNGLDNLPSGRHDTERRESASVDHRLTIDEHFILAIVPVNHIDFDSEVAPKLRRHTDGVQARQSIRAITNGNPGHRNHSSDIQPTLTGKT
jgi:hypothetical protein